MSEFFFWLSVSFIIYTYIGYPLLLLVFTKCKKATIIKSPIQPTVSVVLAVRNEADRISARLQNLCEQDYPVEKMEILAVSDGSDDGTNELIQMYPDKRVKLIKLTKSSGKAVAVNVGVTAATGEILVFADARQKFEPKVISELVANFADSDVGCAGGELVFLSSPDSNVRVEMGAYWTYEKLIRRMESNTGSVIGVSGCIYAMRRALYQPLVAGAILDDVLTPMNILHQGYRVIFDPAAIAYDVVSKDARQEWKRKVRTLTGNWQLLSLIPWLLFPWQNSEWFRVISHKICRLCIPAVLLLLLASGFVSGAPFYIWSTLAQTAFYITAFLGVIVPKSRKFKVVGFAYFFVLLNVAVVLGFRNWLHGESNKVWAA